MLMFFGNESRRDICLCMKEQPEKCQNFKMNMQNATVRFSMLHPLVKPECRSKTLLMSVEMDNKHI